MIYLASFRAETWHETCIEKSACACFKSVLLLINNGGTMKDIYVIIDRRERLWGYFDDYNKAMNFALDFENRLGLRVIKASNLEAIMAKKESKIEKFIENSKSIRERNRNISNEDIERINKISEEASNLEE